MNREKETLPGFRTEYKGTHEYVEKCYFEGEVNLLMMDQAYIEAIIKVILTSNIKDVSLRRVNVNAVDCKVVQGRLEEYKVIMHCFDKLDCGVGQISDAWIVGNILIFTLFDGFLESKYNLLEGESFKNHYENITCNDDIEIIQKDCYRIMKLLRNAVQHNLSNIKYQDGGYVVCYQHKGTNFSLKISREGVSLLYTIVIYLVEEKISGLTKGHFNGIIRKLYGDMCDEIDYMKDEFGVRTNKKISGLRLGCYVRYAVYNPNILTDSGKIIITHISSKSGIDEKGMDTYYPIDYVYNKYLLPQELGTIIPKKQDEKFNTIEFDKTCISDLWLLN